MTIKKDHEVNTKTEAEAKTSIENNQITQVTALTVSPAPTITNLDQLFQYKEQFVSDRKKHLEQKLTAKIQEIKTELTEKAEDILARFYGEYPQLRFLNFDIEVDVKHKIPDKQIYPLQQVEFDCSYSLTSSLYEGKILVKLVQGNIEDTNLLNPIEDEYWTRLNLGVGAVGYDYLDFLIINSDQYSDNDYFVYNFILNLERVMIDLGIEKEKTLAKE